jgi:hypothetical protein
LTVFQAQSESREFNTCAPGKETRLYSGAFLVKLLCCPIKATGFYGFALGWRGLISILGLTTAAPVSLLTLAGILERKKKMSKGGPDYDQIYLSDSPTE